MKVTDITLTPLAIGKGLLRVQTDAGVEGFAEVPGRNSAVFNAYLDGAIKPALIGARDPRLVDRHCCRNLRLRRADVDDPAVRDRRAGAAQGAHSSRKSSSTKAGRRGRAGREPLLMRISPPSSRAASPTQLRRGRGPSRRSKAVRCRRDLSRRSREFTSMRYRRASSSASLADSAAAGPPGRVSLPIPNPSLNPLNDRPRGDDH